MKKEKSNQKKECEICNSYATSLCFECNNYYCDSCFKLVHDKQINSSHKKELIDPFVPIDLKCPEHPKYPMDFFCIDEKGNK